MNSRVGGLEGYVPFDQSIELVKLRIFQPFKDPALPKEKPFPKDLQLAIANDLNVYLRQLSYYTAIGSPLDTFHGIDAFIELDLGDEHFIRITLDITSDPDKFKYKADVVIDWPSQGVDRKSEEGIIEWEKITKKAATDIKKLLEEKAEEMGLQIHSLNKEELKKMEDIREAKRAKESFIQLPEPSGIRKIKQRVG